MSNELLGQLAQELAQILGGGSNSNGLGFCPIPENQNAVKYLFPGYEECSAGRPPYLVALDNNVRVPIPQPAIKCKLKFLNLIDTITGGVDKQKLEFWIDCGNRTYVIYLGWSDDGNGKLNKATESFLKALASLTPDELLEPFTFTLSRLVDKPSYDPTKAGIGATKILLVDVWKNSGERVFSEQGHMDANTAAGVIVRINQHLTGQAVLTPRQPKPKTTPTPQPQPPVQQQWGQQFQSLPQQYQQPTPVVQPQQPIPQNYQQYQQPQNLPQPQTTPQPSQQPQVQTPPVVGGLSPEMMAQFLAFQQQQAQNLPQSTPLEQAQQSLTPPPQWGSVAPTPPPTPPQNGNGGGKINW